MQQHGTGQGAGNQEEEVEGWASGLRKGASRGRERGEQGTETARRPDNREGDLDERPAAADEEDERAGQDGGWATLLLSCLLFGFKIC